MNKPRYTPVRRRTREEILTLLSGRNPNEMRDALISAAYWERDWKWAQEQLLKFADYDNHLVQWAVGTGLGFIAALNGEIDDALVRPALNRLKSSSNANVVTAAEEAEADIDHFVRARKEGEDIHLAERLPEEWRPPSEHFLE
jgi:hypothetical protein